MSWLPKRDKLDLVQASAIDFVVAQDEKGNAGCAAFFIVIAVGYLPSVASFAQQSGYSSAIIGKISGC